MEEELGLVGVIVDDIEVEFICSICEMELLDGKQILVVFVLLLFKVCNNLGFYSNLDFFVVVLFVFGKFCMISVIFCDFQFCFLFIMLEKFLIFIVWFNFMVVIGDLVICFFNLVDFWIFYLYVCFWDFVQ